MPEELGYTPVASISLNDVNPGLASAFRATINNNSDTIEAAINGLVSNDAEHESEINTMTGDISGLKERLRVYCQSTQPSTSGLWIDTSNS